MAVTYPPIPPADDLQALVRATLANAHDLLDDAELLADPEFLFPCAAELRRSMHREIEPVRSLITCVTTGTGCD